MTKTLIKPEQSKTTAIASDKLVVLRELERKILWLSSWMIHNANHVRESRDGIKVGGHQSSCASVAGGWNSTRPKKIQPPVTEQC